MTEELPKHQLEDVINRDRFLLNLVFGAHRGAFAEIFEGGCRLMARPVFKDAKCVLYSRSGSRSCMTCPRRKDLRREKDMVEVASAVHEAKCPKCERTMKTFAQSGLCLTCDRGVFSTMSQEDVRAFVASGKDVRVLSMNAARAARGAEGRSGKVSKLKVPEGAVLVRFDEDRDLYARIHEAAAKNRRPVETEIVCLLVAALDGSGPKAEQGGDAVSAARVTKLIERLKKYPTPSGDGAQVYQAALNLVRMRVEELAEIE